MNLISLVNGIRAIPMPKNFQESPLLIFNMGYEKFVLSVGRIDTVDPLNRVLDLIPFEKETVEKATLLIHVSQEGNGIIKDFFRKYRSVASGNAIFLTSKTGAKSGLWFKKTSSNNSAVFRIIHGQDCLTASTSTRNDSKRLAFVKCEENPMQVWGAVARKAIDNRMEHREEDEEERAATDAVEETIERLHTYAMRM
ncbi:hypothetical protein ECANGB1_1952 [Enterospora canceri]|uniref:Uncharacterized protein n=1 Tax=Enterospora canceri TaxID=1081671 RepID=A0A1Y1S5B9_9MICR|nr:hypothetical protein ECANGB1_1952 [Enterospora canceri]